MDIPADFTARLGALGISSLQTDIQVGDSANANHTAVSVVAPLPVLAPVPASVFTYAHHLRLLSSLHLIQHALHLPVHGAPPTRADLLLVSFDVEEYGDEPRPATELGVSILDSRDIDGMNPGPHGQLIHSRWRHVHFRMPEHAHLWNTQVWARDKGLDQHDKFEFGVTEFIRTGQIGDVLLKLMQIKNANPALNRTVVLLGHAMSGDLSMLRKHFGIDLSKHPNIISTVDSQLLAYSYLPGTPYPKSKLSDIINLLDWDSTVLHNAGNDSAHTGMAIVQIALQCYHGANSIYFPPSHLSNLAAQPIMEVIKSNMLGAARARSRTRNDTHGVFGPTEYCTRCARYGHMSDSCKHRSGLFCDRCLARRQHVVEHCFWRGTEKLEEERAKNAANNAREDLEAAQRAQQARGAAIVVGAGGHGRGIAHARGSAAVQGTRHVGVQIVPHQPAPQPRGPVQVFGGLNPGDFPNLQAGIADLAQQERNRQRGDHGRSRETQQNTGIYHPAGNTTLAVQVPINQQRGSFSGGHPGGPGGFYGLPRGRGYY
jgi:hypothetical protein